MLTRLNPAVPRRYLYVLAGVLWTIAGGVLCVRALVWLDRLSLGAEVVLETTSLVLSIAAYIFLFARLVQKSIDRIAMLPDRVCLFAFTPWRGYIMIILMITLGLGLRSTPIPRLYLSIPYAAMGGTLLIGSVRFYRHFLAGTVQRQE